MGEGLLLLPDEGLLPLLVPLDAGLGGLVSSLVAAGFTREALLRDRRCSVFF